MNRLGKNLPREEKQSRLLWDASTRMENGRYIIVQKTPAHDTTRFWWIWGLLQDESKTKQTKTNPNMGDLIPANIELIPKIQFFLAKGDAKL